MSTFKLEASKREILGKKVKKLRAQGLIPGIIYGPDTDPIAISVDRKELRQTLLQAGGTQIINVDIDKQTIPTLARVVQRDYVQNEILHIDLYKVNMDQEIRAEVPIILLGESQPVTSREAVLNQILNSIEVEALPADLPPQIEVDMGILTEVGQILTVGELTLPTGVRATADEIDPVVKLDYPREIPVEEEEEDEDLLFEVSAEPEVITERSDDEDEE